MCPVQVEFRDDLDGETRPMDRRHPSQDPGIDDDALRRRHHHGLPCPWPVRLLQCCAAAARLVVVGRSAGRKAGFDPEAERGYGDWAAVSGK